MKEGILSVHCICCQHCNKLVHPDSHWTQRANCRHAAGKMTTKALPTSKHKPESGIYRLASSFGLFYLTFLSFMLSGIFSLNRT